ncbi:histidine kinase [Clostridium sp. cel8]|uniref:histidine kinase n=1 Tax=Clostridium sp. cel8 TaxID=2663123 RepID=UPI0015F63B5B|nr:histidine kinase [Clostridium sp. cel8]
MSLVFVTEFTFSSFVSKILISTSITFIILGKILTITKKNRDDISIRKDIGIIIALLIALISRLIN